MQYEQQKHNMRLWHQKLIPYLDKKRLLSQHRECCALRGKGWKRKHATVDYVFKYDLAHLYEYHCMVMYELTNRGCVLEGNWYNRLYRGKNMPSTTLSIAGTYIAQDNPAVMIYPEHNDEYMLECLYNLKKKNAKLTNGKSIDELLIEYELKV